MSDQILYTSTRDASVRVSAAEAIARGISPEGGLYVPCSVPAFTHEELTALIPQGYAARAEAVLRRFLCGGALGFTEAEVADCAAAAYGARFDTPAVAPLRPLADGRYMLELWHGPTCAFKDMALQILPHLMRVSVQKTAPGQQIVILVATSGDTGKAALEGFRDAPDTQILAFYPQDGVSEMQRLQMITQEGGNVGVCAIRGNFDDAQTGVKTLFTDPAVIRRLADKGKRFSSANSINWGRLLPQIVYYVSAYLDLLRDGALGADGVFDVAVPTGNFGNILAAYYARRMGVPIRRLICASNRNRVLTDFFESGVYDGIRPFYTTTSPSMDILVSSNLERLIYHLSGDDSGVVADLMAKMKKDRRYAVPAAVKAQTDALFSAGSADDAEAADTVRRTFDREGYLLDTHTAVALHVVDRLRAQSGDRTPVVVASTANPYKFAPAILDALGSRADGTPFAMLSALHERTGVPIPAPLAALDGKQIRFTDSCDQDVASMEAAMERLLHI